MIAGIISGEINYRIIQSDIEYFANLELLKSSLLTNSTNVYKTLRRSVVEYAVETFKLAINDENALRISKRKIIRWA